MTMTKLTQPVSIRPVEADDLLPLAQWIETIPLWQRYGLTASKARLQLMRGLSAGDVLLVADCPAASQERACGLAWCVPGGAFGRSMYLRLLGVHPALAGQGIGRALLEQAEAAALDVGSDLFLLVSDFNHDAQRFYRRQGYEQVGAIPDYVVPGVTELIFRKRL